MELRRVVGRLAPRWLVLVIAGLVAAAGAFIFVQQRNGDVEPVYNAEASVEIPVAVVSDGRGPSSDIPPELAEALAIAEQVNEEELRRIDRFVNADAETGTLIFTAIEETQSDAIAAAVNMRALYVDADPSFDADAVLKKNLAEADIISKRLEELVPTPAPVVEKTPEEIAVAEAQLELLNAQQAAITAKISELSSDRVETTDSGEISDIEDDLDNLKVQLEELLVILIPLQAAAEPVVVEEDVEPDLPLPEKWTVAALEGRLTDLETESAALIVAGVTGADIELPDTAVTDESPNIVPIWLGIFVGFFAGVVIWSAVLIAWDRFRGVVWHTSDVKGLAVLTEGPAYSLGSDNLTDAERQRRKRSVQAIRSSIIRASREEEGVVVGFAAPSSTDSLVREDLAYDVAASVSAVGRSVLVVDLGFRPKTGLETFLMGEGGGLRELFDSVVSDEETIRNRAAAVIAAADTLSPGLDVLVADADVIDPADILAGRPLSELLDQAREGYDFVIVIQPSTSVVSGAGVDAYLQQQIIVCTRGKTSVREIEAEAIPPTAPHVQMVAVAILIPDAPSGAVRNEESQSSVQSLGAQSGSSFGRHDDAEMAGAKRASVSRSVGDSKVDRIRRLESYSVDESSFIESSKPPADSA